MFGRDKDGERSKRSKRSKRSSEPSSSSQPGSSNSRAPATEPRSPRRGQASDPRVQVWIPMDDPTYPDGKVPMYPDLVTEEEDEMIKDFRRNEQQQRDDHARMWAQRAGQMNQILERQRDEAIQRQSAAREKARAEQEQRQRYEEMVRSTQAASLSPPAARTPAPRAASTANQSPTAAPSHDPYKRDLERMMRETDEVLGNRSFQPSTAASSFFQPANSGGQASGPGQQPRRNADPRAHHNADPTQQYFDGYNDAWPRGAMPMHLGILSKEEDEEIKEHQRRRENEEKARVQRAEQQRFAPAAYAQAGSAQSLVRNEPVSPRRQPYSGYLQPGQTSYPNAPFMPQQQLSSGSAQPAQPMSPSSGSSVPTTPQDQRVPGSGTPFRGYRRRNHRPSGTPQFGVIGPDDPFLELTYGEATYDPRSGQGSSSDDDDR